MSGQTPISHSRRHFLGTSVALGAGLALGSVPRASLANDHVGEGRTSHAAAAASDPVCGAVALAMSVVMSDGLSDVLPRPFEVDLLATSPHLQVAVFDRVVTRIGRQAFDSSEFKPLEYVFLPKRNPGVLRRCAVIEPVDLIAYLALAVLAGPRIEACRPSRAEKSVFSFRFAGQPRALFDRRSTYGTFARHVNRRRHAEETAVLVTADIETFYDRLALDVLQTDLRRCAVEAWVVDYLMDLLSFWSAGTGRGLPVGSNASRILAESVLAGIDEELRSAGVLYARFVDDFRMFAPDSPTAEAWLDRLTRALRQRDLDVNLVKTRLVDPRTLTPLGETASRSRSDVTVAQDTRGSDKNKNDPDQSSKTPTDGKTKPGEDPNRELSPDSWKDRPRRFRGPRRSEYRLLRGLELASLGEHIRGGGDGSSAALCDFVSGAIAQRDLVAIRQMPDLVRCCPDGLAYAVSALVATADEVPDDVRADLADRFARLLFDRRLSSHLALEVVVLLGSDGYRRPDILVAYLSTLGPSAGTYLGRAVLDALMKCDAAMDRRTVARLYGRLNAWGRRAILTPALGGAMAATLPPVLRSARSAAATDPFMGMLVEVLERPVVG